MIALPVASAVERTGWFIGAFTILAMIVYFVVTFRQRDPEEALGAGEIELAPNRKPYFDDEALEGRRLERALGWALVLLVISAIGPLVYWLNEPSRQAGAIDMFNDQAVERGRKLFLPTDAPEHGAHFGCATCHGADGSGGVTKYTLTGTDGKPRTVQWAAPAVNTALLKFSPEEVETILIYGRANTPMPAWGVKGGGPMNDQQITDLVAYLDSIKLTPSEARAQSLKNDIEPLATAGGSVTDGETLFKAVCARCHTKGWSYGEPEEMGGGAFGPNLTNGTTTRQFPDVETMTEFITNGSEFAKPYGTRGVGGNEGGGMPGFGKLLTPEQIQAIIKYERGL
ncbi:MAG TPA: c-type cytochrome [Acidimicrobiales bacterium]|nr:c-type cytochrome [Acidimicrobiales bacterium]